MHAGVTPFSWNRRRVLRGLAALTAMPALPAAATTWRNWSGNQQARPTEILYPADEEQLVEAVRAARSVRAVGGAHSFSPVVNTDGSMVSLEALNGLVAHDAQRHEATFWAGTRLFQASRAAAEIGQSFANEPDINLQSLGGIVSTATHGTGRGLACMSDYVSGLRLVTASGEVLDCDARRNPDVFEVARVAVGSAGILTQLRFSNLPLYRLREQVRVLDLDEAMRWVDTHKDDYRHIEFFAFLGAGKAIVVTMQMTNDEATPEAIDRWDENRLLDWAANLVRRAPWLNRWLQQLVGFFVEESTRVDEAWRIFPNARGVPFNEMQYQVPAEQGMACLEEVSDAVRRSGEAMFFPVEFRYVKGDALWLSPFHARDSAAISVHRYYLADPQPLFSAVEPVFARYAGRPHWGKLHSLGSAQLRELYPRWEDFLQVRAALDPHGKFLNAHMRHLFGVRQ